MQTAFMTARASMETKGVFAHGAMPEPIASSWHRCLQHGLDPTGKPIDAVISFAELRAAKEQNDKLLAVVRPELELLSNQIAGTNFLTAFADCNGVVLDTIIDTEFQESDCSRSIRTGSIWREELRGTNALGMALYTGETSMVTGSEHFYGAHSVVSCVSAPIFDSQGQIVGLLDASSEVAARQYHTKALVSLAATNIENRLFVDEHRTDNIIQFHPREEYLTTQSVGMISIDEDGQITGVNRRAGEILTGLNLSSIKSFSDLFQGGVSASLSDMASGEIIRLVDWLNSSYFARIRITRPPSVLIGAKRTISLGVPAVYELPKSPNVPVNRDDQVHNALRLASRCARTGSPFCIYGAPGTGRTTMALSIHNSFHKESPLIAVDCQSANSTDQSDQLIADILGDGDNREFSIETGGTLLLENLSRIRGGSAENLAQITNRLLQAKTVAKWLIITTEDVDASATTVWPAHVNMALSQLTQLKIHLPPLCERADFDQIAVSILSGISPGHRLATSAIDALRQIDFQQNLTDLILKLRIIAVQCPIGIIRYEHVERHLGLEAEINGVCPRCSGNVAQEAKCREINRVFHQCSSNVALAARKLGVSRNTVYSHISK